MSVDANAEGLNREAREFTRKEDEDFQQEDAEEAERWGRLAVARKSELCSEIKRVVAAAFVHDPIAVVIKFEECPDG